ncbi:MAG: hypothetical protein A2X56_06380 [Nitrospirae bacterium GWC2_57_13]|nr:MAG: hypothetical protein A2X56_06380 [Nitrospirae bacterium GWC2_57_13]OGW45519.1 MAG: hypothetical protein A2X57_09340 [Nitrospirae bacterium GWD2_57_8]HAS54426.1 hypothetical protein [Nitrospiraceae bacterium]
MKILSILLLAAGLTLAAIGTVPADDLVTVKGTVTSISKDAGTITIKPKSGAEVAIVMEDRDLLGRVRAGEVGEVRYRVKDGVNSGVNLRRLVQGCE